MKESGGSRAVSASWDADEEGRRPRILETTLDPSSLEAVVTALMGAITYRMEGILIGGRINVGPNGLGGVWLTNMRRLIEQCTRVP